MRTKFERDNLFLTSETEELVKPIVVKQGQVLTRGSVLGIESASGECVLVDKSLDTGAEKAHCILTDDIDTTDSSKKTTGYFKGYFRGSKLVFGGTSALADHEAELRTNNIDVG